MSDTKSNDMQRVQERRLQEKKIKQDFLSEVDKRVGMKIREYYQTLQSQSKIYAHKAICGNEEEREYNENVCKEYNHMANAVKIINNRVATVFIQIKKEVAYA